MPAPLCRDWKINDIVDDVVEDHVVVVDVVVVETAFDEACSDDVFTCSRPRYLVVGLAISQQRRLESL